MTINEQRFVLDANVLISALLFRQGNPRKALKKAQATGVVLMSDSTFDELERVLLRPKFDKYLLPSQRIEFLQDLAETVQFVDVTAQIFECRDPKDNQYLELAVSGKADCIVTGDDDLLVLNPFGNIKILTAQAFLED
ncbi:MAG: putative toxin-antitoxin system toxin component, PIN family [Thermosynechococcaceae cyanobacterium]